jgi:hypothetical protein
MLRMRRDAQPNSSNKQEHKRQIGERIISGAFRRFIGQEKNPRRRRALCISIKDRREQFTTRSFRVA